MMPLRKLKTPQDWFAPVPGLGEPPAGPAPPVAILGVPVQPLRAPQVIEQIAGMIESGQPHQIVTANVDFLRQARGDPELQRVLLDADLVVGDGMPLVWASRWLGQRLPERVAGADLLAPLMVLAQTRGYRVYLLGGRPAVAEQAAAVLRRRHLGLQLAHYAPPHQPLLAMDHQQIVRRILAFAPQLVLVAFGCPKAEKWIALHRQELGVPVAMGIGATLDFVAGQHRRAPAWMQRSGTEWLFRLAQEPGRLGIRYARDLRTVCQLAAQALWWRVPRERRARPEPMPPLDHGRDEDGLLPSWSRARLPVELTGASVQREQAAWAGVLADSRPCLLDASAVVRLDSAGLGWLLELRRRLRRQNRFLVLVGPSPLLRRVWHRWQLTTAFEVAEDIDAAGRLFFERAAEPMVREIASGVLAWQGEITAATQSCFWEATRRFLGDWGVSYRPLVLDLAQVRYLDSAGVQLIRRARSLAAQRRIRLRVRGACPLVDRLLRSVAAEERRQRSQP